ncbi:hypothetical protein AKJ16_DCAP12567 [Drosera capensis]
MRGRFLRLTPRTYTTASATDITAASIATVGHCHYQPYITTATATSSLQPLTEALSRSDLDLESVTSSSSSHLCSPSSLDLVARTSTSPRPSILPNFVGKSSPISSWSARERHPRAQQRLPSLLLDLSLILLLCTFMLIIVPTYAFDADPVPRLPSSAVTATSAASTTKTKASSHTRKVIQPASSKLLLVSAAFEAAGAAGEVMCAAIPYSTVPVSRPHIRTSAAAKPSNKRGRPTC